MGKQWREWLTILGGSKITAGGDCSHEIKRCLLFRRKDMTDLDCILKSRDITLSANVCLVTRLLFFQWSCMDVSWTMKKVEHRRIDAFELWCWRRLLRVPCTARRSVLAVYWKDWCWSWNSNILATWREELAHLKRPLFWERLRAGGEGDERGWDGWTASLTQWTWIWVNR